MRLVKLVQDSIREHRQTFIDASPGSKTSKTDQAWRAIYRESELDAQRQLLAGSNKLAECDRLLAAASEAKRKADEASAQINRSWSEFTAIPSKLEAAHNRLAAIANEKLDYDGITLDKAYRDLFQARMTGAVVNIANLAKIAAMILESPLRLECLDEAEKLVKTEIPELKRRDRELAKALGTESH